jgi:hypothetical protein
MDCKINYKIQCASPLPIMMIKIKWIEDQIENGRFSLIHKYRISLVQEAI